MSQSLPRRKMRVKKCFMKTRELTKKRVSGGRRRIRREDGASYTARRPGRCIRSFSWTGRSRTRMHKRVRRAGVPPGSASGSSGISCSTSCRSPGFPPCFPQQVLQNQTCSMRLEAMDYRSLDFRQVIRPGGGEERSSSTYDWFIRPGGGEERSSSTYDWFEDFCSVKNLFHEI